MELNREQEQRTKQNDSLSSVYSYNDLCEYLKRINAAASYKGNSDCEDVPIILREFIKGYEQKIKKLTAEKEVLAAELNNYKEWYFKTVDENKKLRVETILNVQERLNQVFGTSTKPDVAIRSFIGDAIKEMLQEV